MSIQLIRVETVGAPVAKHGLTLEEVADALGSLSLVKELRAIGALAPVARKSKAILFDGNAVARVWAEFCAGRYDEQLATWRSTRA